MTEAWPWLALFGLGAFHGINPAMGWLFAVALGLQERRRGAVLAALPPIALGHALSIAAVLALLYAARESLPAWALKAMAAAVLLGFGLYRLVRSRHPGWVGMRVGFRDLTAWSFLMASAHGAGLMLVPILLAGEHAGHTGGHAGHSLPPDQATAFATPLAWLGAVAVHTLGHLLVAAALALLVYEKLGLSLLRSAWFNLDLVWGIALVLCGVLILVV
ncbi:MAG TPA: hypothetical protein VN493_23695 [Thermoanaerobaculia bacterium]|nr:hypothetical protein [Thermoanaerobaculia bacterium]